MHFSIYVISHSSTGGSLNCEALIHVKEDFVEEIRRSNCSVVQESCKNIIIIAFPIVIYINLFLGISICFWANCLYINLFIYQLFIYLFLGIFFLLLIYQIINCLYINLFLGIRINFLLYCLYINCFQVEVFDARSILFYVILSRCLHLSISISLLRSTK